MCSSSLQRTPTPTGVVARTVSRHSDVSTSFYVVVHGEFQRDYGGDFNIPPAQLRIGAYFGEIGLLLQRTPMLATVTATEDSTLLTVGRTEFMAVLNSRTMVKTSLCIRIQERSKMQLELLLLDPKMHVAWVDFACAYLESGLRLPVYNAAASLQHTARLVAASLHEFSSETTVGILDSVLFEQARQLVELIEQSSPAKAIKGGQGASGPRPLSTGGAAGHQTEAVAALLVVSAEAEAALSHAVKVAIGAGGEQAHRSFATIQALIDGAKGGTLDPTRPACNMLAAPSHALALARVAHPEAVHDPSAARDPLPAIRCPRSAAHDPLPVVIDSRTRMCVVSDVCSKHAMLLQCAHEAFLQSEVYQAACDG